MRYKELESLKPAERKKKQQEAELELLKQRAQVATGTTPKNPNQIRQLRKTLAQIKTLEVKEKDA